MSKQDLKKIGEAFYTTKIKGTGLGISMVKQIIKLHQGTISYDSTLEKGTSVAVMLPSYINF
jgi:two-component system sporulation sensor kinase B